MDRPMRILDLFSGAGGASMGYHRAFPNAEITGVDINPQPHYPFKFVQADASSFPLEGYDLIHASPPCQGYTTMSAKHRGCGGVADQHPRMVNPMRDRLKESGSNWVLENVPGARREMENPVLLRGGHFGLGVDRPRLFDSSFRIEKPETFSKVENPIGVYGEKPDGRWLWVRKDGTRQRAAASLEEGQKAMGIDWMPWRGLAESIPPAYTEHIGRNLSRQLTQGMQGNPPKS